MIQMADIIIPSFPPPPPPKLTKLIIDSLNIAVQGSGDSHRETSIYNSQRFTLNSSFSTFCK